MHSSREAAVQTDPNPIIKFLTRYDFSKIFHYTYAQLYKEQEVLELSVLRHKGRPSKAKSCKNIEAVLIPDKIKIINEKFSDFIHGLMTMVSNNAKTASLLYRKDKFLKKRRNIEYVRKNSNSNIESNENKVSMPVIQLDDSSVQKLIESLPRIRSAGYIDGLNPKIQLAMAYYLKFVQTSGFFSQMNTINLKNLQNMNKTKIFNIFCLLSAFLTVVGDFISLKTLISFYTLSLCFLDYVYDRYRFASYLNVSVLHIDGSELILEEDNSLLLNADQSNQFFSNWFDFIETTPGRYLSHLYKIDHRGEVAGFELEIRLVGLCREFVEIFMDIENFYDRLK